MPGVIYGIGDVSGVVRYVGKTTMSLERRLREHWYVSRRGVRTPLACWLRTLDTKPDVVVLEQDCPDLDVAERWWIADLRPTGRLLNVLDGGQGWTPGRPQSAESNRKRRETQTGRSRPPEVVARIAAIHRGMKRSEETCRRISEAKKGRPGRRRVWSDEMVAQLIATYAETGAAERTAIIVGVGRRQTFDKLRDLGVLRPRRGRGPQSPESRAKISAANIAAAKRRRDALAMESA